MGGDEVEGRVVRREKEFRWTVGHDKLGWLTLLVVQRKVNHGEVIILQIWSLSTPMQGLLANTFKSQ